jgi:hypothetical protein
MPAASRRSKIEADRRYRAKYKERDREKNLAKLAKWRAKYYAETHSISTRLDLEMYGSLRQYAKQNKCTVAEAIRIFIEWGLEA